MIKLDRTPETIFHGKGAALLLSSARFGSSYFLDIYRQLTPAAVVLNEIFRKGSDSLDILEGLLEQPANQIRNRAAKDPVRLWQVVKAAAAERGAPIIAKAYYYHRSEASPLWDEVRQNDRIIHLVRRNLFEAYLSRQLAQATGTWWVRRGDGMVRPNITLQVNRADAERFIASKREEIAKFRGILQDANYTEIFFEDIVRSPLRCASEVKKIFGQDRAGLPAEGVVSSYQALRHRSNADLVSNYTEVADLDVEAIECHQST